MRFNFKNLFVFSMLLVLLANIAGAQTATGKQSGGTAPAASKQTAGKKTAGGKTAGKRASTRHRRARKGSWKRKGQQAIQPERTREIQAALIREKYMTGEPSGKWDARTQDAMIRYQADHGWQTKVTPDSRALIKLGLGPNYSSEEMLNLEPRSDAVAASTGSARVSTGANRDKQ